MRSARFSTYSLVLLVGGLAAASCGGDVFSGGAGGGGTGASGGKSGHAGAGAGTSTGAGGGASSGESGSGGTPGSPGLGGVPGALGGAGGDTGEPGGAAGEPGGAAGSGGASVVVDCEALEGQELDGHCYVDATVGTPIQADAVAACEQLAAEVQRPGHLLVLDSTKEQTFILERFMVAFTDVSDAWLALTCSELVHPDINACHCLPPCSEATLLQKQQAWDWLDGSMATFGWVNGNPNNVYRCAALGFNPATTIWGWVDRPCDRATISPMPMQVPHTYRTICELEL
ncbi:MAG TPA: hypothetical protein VIW29_03335 [Polyangiaceae bacterium]